MSINSSQESKRISMKVLKRLAPGAFNAVYRGTVRPTISLNVVVYCFLHTYLLAVGDFWPGKLTVKVSDNIPVQVNRKITEQSSGNINYYYHIYRFY